MLDAQGYICMQPVEGDKVDDEACKLLAIETNSVTSTSTSTSTSIEVDDAEHVGS